LVDEVELTVQLMSRPVGWGTAAPVRARPARAPLSCAPSRPKRDAEVGQPPPRTPRWCADQASCSHPRAHRATPRRGHPRRPL